MSYLNGKLIKTWPVFALFQLSPFLLYKYLENFVGKREIARNKLQLLLSQSTFSPLSLRELSANFINRFPLVFTCLQYETFVNTVGKGEIA